MHRNFLAKVVLFFCCLFPAQSFSGAEPSPESNTSESSSSLISTNKIDIDGNEKFDALTDGLLLLRSMFELSGGPLITGVVADDAVYTSSSDIETRITALGDRVDIDDDGRIDALTDGLLILRYLFELSGDALTAGVISDGAQRASAVDIESYLLKLTTFSPVFTSGANFSAVENQLSIGTVLTTDTDSGDSVTFTVSGSELSITSAGVLTFTSASDYEVKASYTATVTATDGINTTTQDITVNVVDVDDVAPIFTSGAVFSAAENQLSIGIVTATDVDSDSESISFTVSGSELAITSGGVLSFKVAPDYETKATHTATVTASDGANTATQDITVNVTESTREPLKINAISDTMRININGLDVLTLETNRLTPLTYSIGGEDANYFLFNSSGKLTFKEPHNFKLKTSYKVTLNITDTADNSETGTVSNPITLFMVMRADPLYEGSEHWEPSRIGQCDYQKNISPSLKAITNSLGTGTQYRQIVEPLTIFDDETTTILVSGLDTNDNVVDLEVALNGGAASFEDESGTNGFSLYAYDDGTHGDLFAGDKVWTRSCLSINKEVLETDPSLDPIITREVRVVRKEYRGTEPAPKIVNTSLSVNDTGFFYRNDQHFLINAEQSFYQPGWILADPARSDALKQIWDYKGSIFNIYALTSNNLGWNSGMWRIHDFLDGLGHSPGCDNVPGYSSGSHCYSFADGKDHPELMAGITIENKPNFSGFTHELEHALIGFTMRGFPEENPLGICDQKADCLGTSLSRELTTDFAHIEAATTLISTLKGPPWNPTFGAPASVRIGSEEQSVDGTIIYDDNDKKFKLVNRDNHYIVSDFVLYHMGLIAKTDAMKDEYKIMNYSFPDCVTSSDENEKTLFCPDNYEFKYDEYIKFNVSDSIAKFGEYSNPRGLDVYDPANINVAIVHIGGRNHTDAEYTLLSKTYRSWARFDTSKVKLYFDRKKLDGDIPWSTSLGGLSRVNIDFSH